MYHMWYVGMHTATNGGLWSVERGFVDMRMTSDDNYEDGLAGL